jgi:hypothetical protein
MNSTKLIAGMIAVATLFGGVSGASAATAEELAAQITALQSQLASLQGQLGTTTTTTTTTSTTTSIGACAGISFTRNLTLGSTGTDVKCLQALLNESADTQVALTGVGSKGSETEYFGGLTKTAVIKFQNKFAAEVLTPVGLTSGTGFVGAQTRVKLNAILAGTTTTTTDDDDDDTTTTTTTTTTTGDGEEGDFTVTLNSTPSNNQKVEEGEEGQAVMGLKIKATGSDIDIQRVTLAFDTKPYNAFTKLYLYDGSTVVAEVELSADTVSKVDSDDYRITISNFESKFTVAEGVSKVLTVKVDAEESIDDDDMQDVIVYLPTSSSVRGVDEAGLNQYGGGDGADDIARTIALEVAASEGATLTISTNDDTPLDRNVVADDDEIEDATLLVFDAEAEDDDLTITDINNVAITTSVGGEFPDTVYLFDSTNESIAEGDVDYSGTSTAGTVDFEDLDVTIEDGDTETFSIKFDYATDSDDYAAGMTFLASVDGTEVVAENSEEDELDADQYDGSATGNLAYIYAIGPEFTINTITTTLLEATETTGEGIKATFNVVVEAKGGDIYLAKKDGTINAFNIEYSIGDAAGVAIDAANLSYTKPTGASEVTGNDGTFYEIEDGESLTFKVNASQTIVTEGSYDLRMVGINWTDSVSNDHDEFTSIYMDGASEWMSDAETLRP